MYSTVVTLPLVTALFALAPKFTVTLCFLSHKLIGRVISES